MTGSTGSIDYQSLQQKVGQSNDWQSSIEQLRSHPQYPPQAAEAVEQAYQQNQQAFDQMDPQTRTSFAHLVGTFSQIAQTNKEQSQQMAQAITQTLQQVSTNSGGSSR